MKMMELWVMKPISSRVKALNNNIMNQVKYYIMTLRAPIRGTRDLILFCMVSLISLNACGNDGLDTKSVLKNYRILAMRSEPPALSLTEQTEIFLYDFHPGDLSSSGRPDIEYQWKLCPFSLGSVTQYKCLFDEVSLDALV